MKKLIIVAFLLCGFMQAWADTWIDDEGVTWYFYDMYDGDAYIYRSSKTSGELIIPSKVYAGDKEYNVTEIRGFEDYTDLTSVTIPEGVTHIDSEAFYGCTNLATINFPSSIISVGESAFSGTSFLRNQSGLVYIGKVAYRYVGSMPENTSIVIKEGTVQLGEDVFYGCSNLTSIYIPSSVTSFGEFSFFGCNGLTKVIISDLRAWLSIVFPDDDYSTNANPLMYAHHLYIDENTEITDLVIPEGITTINQHAFHGCSGLRSITFPSTLTSIGDCAFNGCTNLTDFIFPESLEKIGVWAFYGCASLTSVTIPPSITGIGDQAFNGAKNIKKVVIPDLASWCKMDFVDSANPMAISNCFYSDEDTKVTDLVIPAGVVSIGQAAFHCCSELISVNLPKGLKSIGRNAFAECKAIEKIYSYEPIPPALGYDAFRNVYNATLYVPYGCKDAYVAKGWSFKIIEMDPEEITFSLSTLGKQTFTSAYDLDFSGTTGVKAYIVSDYNPETGKLLFTQVDEVPAGTGLYLKGDPGDYAIPVKETSKTYSNLLVGLIEDTEVKPVSGNNTNFILANGKYGVSFYTLSKAGTITAGKAYLSLPTSSVENLSKEITFVFEDEEATGISQIPSLLVDDNFYSIDGHVIKGKPTMKGLYIHKGKKVVIK